MDKVDPARSGAIHSATTLPQPESPCAPESGRTRQADRSAFARIAVAGLLLCTLVAGLAVKPGLLGVLVWLVVAVAAPIGGAYLVASGISRMIELPRGHRAK